MSQTLPKQPSPEPDAEPEPAKGWLAAIWPVVLIGACAELGIAVLNNSALPVYFKFGLRMDERVMGFILVPFFISEALFKSPLGVLSDRFGRKPLMLGGALVTIFTPLLLIAIRYDPAAVTAIAVLVCFGFLRLLDGLGQSALWPALFAYVGDVVPEKKRTAAMGLMNVVYMMGLAFGFLAGGFVDDTFGPLLSHEEGVTFGGQMRQVAHRVGDHVRDLGHHHAPVASSVPPPAFYHPQHYYPSFLLSSCLFAIAAIIAALALRGRTRRSTPDGAHEPHEKISWAGFLTSLRMVPQFLAIAFVTFFGIGCLVFVVKIFAMEEFKLSEQQVGGLMLGPALVIALVSVPVGHLADKWGKTRAVRLGFVLCALGLWGIPLLHFQHAVGLTGFVVAASLIGVGFVIAFPAWMALVTSLCDERKRGTVFGAVATAQGIGVLLGSLVGTALYHHSRIAPFVTAAAFVSLGVALALAFVRERVLERQSLAS